MQDRVFSIIIPTYNSERTLELCLQSVRDQNYPQKDVEVLVIDGGSKDRTLSIAENFGARILLNPEVQPSSGKKIGLLNGKGKYLVFLDSDELFDSKEALNTRQKAFELFPDCWLWLSSGYQKPAGAHWINDYINIFSDPFTYFMYGISALKGDYLPALKQRYKLETSEKLFTVFSIGNNKESPLVDFSAGVTIHREKAFQFQHQFSRGDIIPTLSYLIMHQCRRLGVLNEQGIFHYGTESFSRYLNKIKWRVIMNVFRLKEHGPGHISTEPFHPNTFRWKKYLFLPYAFFLPLPLVTGALMAWKKRKPTLLLHFALCFYTAVQIVIMVLRKFLKQNIVIAGYGEAQK